MCAALAGIDAGSDNPHERLKFLVYSRQMAIEAIKTKALMLAALGQNDGASKAAKEYMNLAIPLDGNDEVLAQARKARLLREIGAMEPIPLSKVRVHRERQPQPSLRVVDRKTGQDADARPPPTGTAPGRHPAPERRSVVTRPATPAKATPPPAAPTKPPTPPVKTTGPVEGAPPPDPRRAARRGTPR
jgi:hypothetical protein